MPFYIDYLGDRDADETERRTEKDRDTKRELGLRCGPFEVGYRGETHTHEVDERRRHVREKIKRAFEMGFRRPEPVPAHAPAYA